jgi:hypothetical protein
VRRARNAVLDLVDHGVAPADDAATDSIGWMLALAEHVARTYGARALAVVRTTANAIAELADNAIARARRHADTRNFALELGGYRFDAPPWLSGLGRIAAHVGLDAGALALKSKLGSLGIGADMIGLVEEELNREGLSLGPLARPAHSAAPNH